MLQQNRSMKSLGSEIAELKTELLEATEDLELRRNELLGGEMRSVCREVFEDD